MSDSSPAERADVWRRARQWTAALAGRVRRTLQRSTTWGPLGLAVAVGLLAGAGTVALRGMIRGVQWLTEVSTGLPIPGEVITIAAPAVGLLVVTYLVRAAPEAKGHGVPEVQFAIRMRGGRIRPRVAVAKAVTSAITIGSGGSVGREGPIVQIGASLGSALGQWIGLGTEEVRLLVAAGSAGAIGATFNAPVAGVLFALEVILGTFAARSFGLVVISSVTATAVVQPILGTQPAFRLLAPFELQSNWELTLYPILGLLTGGIALLYVRSVYGIEDWFDRWHVPVWWKAIAGGLVVGLLGTYGSEHLFGAGQEGIELAMAGGLGLGLMTFLVFTKILATSVTLGAGGSGGVFAPALFIGAMAGGAFGRVAAAVFPAMATSPGAYALVGSAAVFGAATHAPMTAIIILFEMTDNYRIILPLMLAVVIAQLMASRVDPDSIYSIKLRRRGALASPTELGTLDLLVAADAMSEDVPFVPAGMSLDALANHARKDPSRSWIVRDEEERLCGIVSVTDLERAIVEGDLEDRTVASIMTKALVTCAPGETLRRAFQRFSDRDVYQIPVVDPKDPGQVLGVLRRTELMWAYKELSEEHHRLVHRRDPLPVDSSYDSVHVELQIPFGENDLEGKRVRDVPVPEHALIALLRRGDRVVVPRGFTKIESGDVLTLITTREHEAELRAWVARCGGGSS